MTGQTCIYSARSCKRSGFFLLFTSPLQAVQCKIMNRRNFFKSIASAVIAVGLSKALGAKPIQYPGMISREEFIFLACRNGIAARHSEIHRLPKRFGEDMTEIEPFIIEPSRHGDGINTYKNPEFGSARFQERDGKIIKAWQVEWCGLCGFITWDHAHRYAI